jgi:hypothetical protein
MCKHGPDFTCQFSHDEFQRLQLHNEILLGSMAIIQDAMKSQRLALDSSLLHINEVTLQISKERRELTDARERLLQESLKLSAERMDLANIVKQLAMLSWKGNVGE